LTFTIGTPALRATVTTSRAGIRKGNVGAGGTKAIAELGSALIKHGMESCNGYDAASDCFRDGVITGKGWITVDQVYDRDPIN
jgi:hypothetical protein